MGTYDCYVMHDVHMYEYRDKRRRRQNEKEKKANIDNDLHLKCAAYDDWRQKLRRR